MEVPVVNSMAKMLTKNDIKGFGFDLKKRSIFYTQNGDFLGNFCH
jgi:hypothetical protein